MVQDLLTRPADFKRCFQQPIPIADLKFPFCCHNGPFLNLYFPPSRRAGIDFLCRNARLCLVRKPPSKARQKSQ
jgi:hypothetical protein